jgi:hypothetical protein
MVSLSENIRLNFWTFKITTFLSPREQTDIYSLGRQVRLIRNGATAVQLLPSVFATICTNRRSSGRCENGYREGGGLHLSGSKQGIWQERLCHASIYSVATLVISGLAIDLKGSLTDVHYRNRVFFFISDMTTPQLHIKSTLTLRCCQFAIQLEHGAYKYRFSYCESKTSSRVRHHQTVT